MDAREFLTKSKDEHGGLLAFTAGALLALLLARSRKAHGVIWWLLIGLPGLLVLLSLAILVAMAWAIVWGGTRLYMATTNGRRPNAAEPDVARQDDSPRGNAAEPDVARQDDSPRGNAAEPDVARQDDSPGGNAGSPSIRRVPSTRLRLSKLWWMLTLPFGVTTWAAFLYAGSRTKRQDLKLVAAAYGGLLLLALIITGVAQGGAAADLGGTLLFVTWMVGIIHAVLIRTSVNRQLAFADDPTLQAAQRELNRREDGRRLLETNPSLAREMGVGRPDLTGSNSFGLIDVNHAGRTGLAMLPGLTEDHVEKLLQYRMNGGYFVSVEDLMIYLDLPPTAIGAIRDIAVFNTSTT